jgi:sugar phosphate isomerase/epimerase
VDEALRAVGELADRVDVMIAMSASLSVTAALDRALRAADCEHFRVDLDPTALLGDPWSYEKAFDALAPRIVHVRLRDAHTAAGGRLVPCAIGDGAVNVPRLMSLLGEAAFDGFLSIDVTDASDRVRSLTVAVKRLRGMT